MGIEIFYKERTKDFYKIATDLDKELTANNIIGDAHRAHDFRRAVSKAKKWSNEVKLSASQNGVDIGTRKNFKEVLQSQFENNLEKNKIEYALYIQSIRSFLEFYCRWF